MSYPALQNGAAIRLELLSEGLREPLGICDKALFRQIDTARIVMCERGHQPLDAGRVNLIANDAAIAPELPCERIIVIRELAVVHHNVTGLPYKIGATRVPCERQMRVEGLTRSPISASAVRSI